MNIKLKTYFMTMIIFLLYGNQNTKNKQNYQNQKIDVRETEITMNFLKEKIRKLSFFYIEEISDSLITNISKSQTKVTLPQSDICQMTIPFLHPNGNTSKDIHLKNTFFHILEMLETLRYLLESYNKFIIHTNLNFLTHPAQVHFSDDILKMINFRKIVRKEILFVDNAIKNYNQEININFPNLSHKDKMAGYYSFDNSHFGYNQDEFSIEDIDNFSFSYHKRLITKNVLKLKRPKAKLRHPETGSRRGTVFIESGKPSILRGALGNDLGSYELGLVIGMTIEYAITGKIYYYKGFL